MTAAVVQTKIIMFTLRINRKAHAFRNNLLNITRQQAPISASFSAKGFATQTVRPMSSHDNDPEELNKSN